ncbi:MAG: type IV pilin [Natronomonas sp.]
MNRRAQSHVIGVAVLLGITIAAIASLTASAGLLIDSHAAEADSNRVATGLESALHPTSSSSSETVHFVDGSLSPVERHTEIRVDGETTHRIRTDGLVYTGQSNRRVVFEAGGLVRTHSGGGTLQTGPTLTRGTSVFVIGITRLGTDVSGVGGSGGTSVSVRTNTTHERHSLEAGDRFTVAIETATPAAWERYFEKRGATTTREPGDPPMVAATFDGDRDGYLVVHDLSLELTPDG